MSQDFSSHSFYGVRLTDAAGTLFDSLYAAARDGLIAAYVKAQEMEGRPVDPADAEELWLEHLQCFDKNGFDTVVAAIPADRLDRVRQMLGAPGDAVFVRTGDADDRPGRCYTEPDQVLLGFGIHAALKMVRSRFAPEHRGSVEWHSWVESW